MWLRYLPNESALASAGFAGDGRWGKIEELLAVVADYVQILDYHFLQVNGGKNLKKPEFVLRPGETREVQSDSMSDSFEEVY